MKIATWNVNSVKARKDRLLSWLERHAPDVLCLQELKVEDHAFPLQEVEQAGYHAALYGQKTYNGVAILSRTAATDVRRGLGAGEPEATPQARLIEARIDSVPVISVYVPNGSRPDSDKYAYKLRWLQGLLAYLDEHHAPDRPLVLCGDLNIAPDARDVARPEQWNETVLCTEEVREMFRRLLKWGLCDGFRAIHAEGGLYSWWDYRMLGFPKNNGLRIDHVLVSEALGSRCKDAYVDRNERKGKSPSDHAPVILELDTSGLS